MCGLKVVVVKSDKEGNVDIDDLKVKAAKYSDRLAALMITYPSTYGVFEEGVTEIIDTVHGHGGQVCRMNTTCSPITYGIECFLDRIILMVCPLLGLHGWRKHERASGLHQPWTY